MTDYKAGDGVTVFGVIATGDVSGGFVAVTFGRSHIAAVPVDDIRTHEPMTLEHRLAGLSVEQIVDALSRKDIALADILETAGAKIAKARREAGEMRRKVTPKEPGPDTRGIMNVGLEHAEAEPKAEQDGLEITSFMLAKHAAKQGRKALDKFMKHLSPETAAEIEDREAELLGMADAADEAAAVRNAPLDHIPF